MADPNVAVIYVATPHSHHFQNAMLALRAGKHVLCEKSLTVNAAQAKRLFETAKERNLFFMEAVWTRFFPLSIKVRELVTSNAIGKVHRVFADLSFGSAKDDGSLIFPDDNRMVNADLAGGALLDLGIYSLTWVFQILYHCQPVGQREKPKVLADIQKYDKTGVDETTSMILSFPKSKSVGIATTSLRLGTPPDREGSPAAGPTARIQGTKGEIQIMGPIYRPTHYRVIMFGGERALGEDVECAIPFDKEKNVGHGMFWEADEAGRCIRDGKLESEGIGWEESLTIMETMDEVRKQGDLVYPELIETSVYDESSPLNVGR